MLNTPHILPDIQLEFRPDRSCIDSLVILGNDIHKGLINNSPTIGAFLDIKGAFDSVIFNILIQDLVNIGVLARLRMFILNLISERQLHFVIDDNLSGQFLSHKSLSPQGSTLSPILFAIYLKDITNYLHKNSHILLNYDIVIYSISNDILLARDSVQKSLDRI